MMKEWLDQFLSHFNQDYLKELGYKKARRTFSRDMGSYWERALIFKGASRIIRIMTIGGFILMSVCVQRL
jgi:hypothetical protein